ncbi:MAG: cytochrome c oxidase subunit II [Oscillochloridaceae bacterium]|nr:cytochrome c oxidase subunit II [Chloroflexaceae bacterium]MDW8390077.1 cytochrome c oxidase subunit II [Oscillochloridaceae bacterium]
MILKNPEKFMAYLFEVAWILPSVAIPVAVITAVVLTAFAVGLRVPDVAGRIDPQAITVTEPFDEPGLRELAPGKYQATMIAQVFLFTPNEIEVPAGSEVTFVLTSRDVIHGFKIVGTSVNMMVVPGQISKLTVRFDRPGEYLIVCHEYCGSGHHVMSGKVIVY